MTRRPESPEVKALEGREDAEPLRSGQLGGQANRRAAAKANGSDAEIGSRTKLIQADISEMPRVSFLYSMASADAEELRSTHRVSRRRLKVAILDSTAVKVRKVRRADRMTLRMSRTGSITGDAGKWAGAFLTGG